MNNRNLEDMAMTMLNSLSIRSATFRECNESLKASGALSVGHFRFGRLGSRDEQHGTHFVNPRRLFFDPFAVRALIQALRDQIPQEIRLAVDVVVGFATCGIILAYELAAHISTERDQGAPDVKVIFLLHDDANDAYQLMPDERMLVEGKRILLVDDLRHTGRTFCLGMKEVTSAGGEVIATAELIDRGLRGLPIIERDRPIPNFPLEQFPIGEMFPPNRCRMCQQGIPISKI